MSCHEGRKKKRLNQLRSVIDEGRQHAEKNIQRQFSANEVLRNVKYLCCTSTVTDPRKQGVHWSFSQDLRNWAARRFPCFFKVWYLWQKAAMPKPQSHFQPNLHMTAGLSLVTNYWLGKLAKISHQITLFCQAK